jgi:hypothetical protein
MGITDVSERLRSEYKYVLRDPDEIFTDRQFDRVQRQILIWSLHKEVPCEVARNADGFTVTVYYWLREDRETYGRSLEEYLRAGIFCELSSSGISISYIGCRSMIPE